MRKDWNKNWDKYCIIAITFAMCAMLLIWVVVGIIVAIMAITGNG